MGQIKGTPTIKFIRPKKKNKRGSNKRKSLSDYNGERKFDGLVEYAEYMQPSHVIKVTGEKEFAKFAAKADSYALPMVLLFTKSRKTSVELKALSSEFRRRLLIGEVRMSKPNQALIAKFGVDSTSENQLVVLSDSSAEPLLKAVNKFKFKRAVSFLSKHALEKPYYEDEAALAKLAARNEAEGEGEAKTEL